MKFLKYTFIFLLILTLGGLITYWVLDKPLPKGEEGPQAEALTSKMLEAINDSAWHATPVVSWNYVGLHSFIWDKARNYTKVSWDDYEIFVDLHKKTGVAYAKGKRVKDSTATAQFVNEAYGYWVNDSFWLNPLTKVRDQGTSRKLIEREADNEAGLLVTYTSGGLTPGDSYLWIIDKDSYRPKAVQRWVSIIPIGGIEFSWEEYVKTETGAIISIFHQGPIDTKINELKTYKSIQELGEEDIFYML